MGVDKSYHDIITPMELKSGDGYIVARYNHSHGTREWGTGVDILWHDIITPMELENGGGYMVARYNHSLGTREWGCIYRGTI